MGICPTNRIRNSIGETIRLYRLNQLIVITITRKVIDWVCFDR